MKSYYSTKNNKTKILAISNFNTPLNLMKPKLNETKTQHKYY